MNDAPDAWSGGPVEQSDATPARVEPPGDDLPKAARYAILEALHPDWDHIRLAVQAGYAYTTSRRDVVSRKQYLVQRTTLDQQRKYLQECTESSLPAMVGVVASIAHDTGLDPRARVSAVKETAELLDLHSPRKVATQVDARIRGLMVEVSDLSRAELEALLSPT